LDTDVILDDLDLFLQKKMFLTIFGHFLRFAP